MSLGGESVATGQRTGRHANATLVVLFLAAGLISYSILQSMVAPALPVIANDLGVTTSDASWVLTAYLLSASVLTPIFGRLGDIAGKRRILLVVIVLLAFGTTLAALAPTLLLLVFARLLQGAAAAILPLSIGIVRDEMPRERVGVTVGLLSATFGIGASVGIIVAGPIVDHLSWPWLFWLPLVLILITLVGVAFGVPESPVRAPGRLDFVGAAILSVGLASLLLAISKGHDWGWLNGRTLGLFAVGAVALLVFVLVELRTDEPLINMHLLALRGVWTANLVGLAVGFVMFGVFLLIPVLIELPVATGYGFGKSVSQAGLFLVPSAAMMLIFGPLSGVLDRRYGPKLPMTLGTISIVIGFSIPAISHHSVAELLVCGFFMGAGVGLVFAAMSNAIVESVPRTHTGEAIGFNSIVRTMGGSIGTAVVAAVLASSLSAGGVPTYGAFSAGFAVCAAVGLLAIFGALAMPSLRRSREEALAAGVEDLPATSPSHR